MDKLFIQGNQQHFLQGPPPPKYYSLSSLLAWALGVKHLLTYPGTDLRTFLYGEHTHLTTILRIS